MRRALDWLVAVGCFVAVLWTLFAAPTESLAATAAWVLFVETPILILAVGLLQWRFIR